MARRIHDPTKIESIQPGAIIVHKSGSVAVVRERKRDDSGWWIRGFGGVSDEALASGNWVIPNMTELVKALAMVDQ